MKKDIFAQKEHKKIILSKITSKIINWIITNQMFPFYLTFENVVYGPNIYLHRIWANKNIL